MVLIKAGKNAGAFTLIEILAVLAIIVILVSLLVPALNMAHNAALVAKEKAHLNSIGVALEAFKNDFGDYPSSTRETTADYYGAQKLAEAIVGRDGLGFHPMSEFRGDGMAALDGDGVYDDPLYHPDIDSLTEAQITANHSARKGPYLELEAANAVKVKNIYNSYGSLNEETYVLADVFGKVKNKGTGGRTGLPILYYKADTSKFLHDVAEYLSGPTSNDNIYNYHDNIAFTQFLKSPDTGTDHPMADPALFYSTTQNPNFTNPVVPYRAQSFILISAGADGLYGTGDDVFNFDK